MPQAMKKEYQTQTTTCMSCGSVVEIDTDEEYAICQMCGEVWAYTI